MVSNNSLDDYQLEYEEMEQKFVGKATSTVKKPKAKTPPAKQPERKVVLQDYLAKASNTVRGKVDNIIAKVKKPRKKAKKLTKNERNAIRQEKKRGIIGIGLLLTVVSIGYSTYMTNLFQDGWAMWLALAPQMLFAAAISIYAFYKIYK